VRKLSEQGYRDVGESYGAAGFGLGLQNCMSLITQLMKQLTRCHNGYNACAVYRDTHDFKLPPRSR
jgi:hypothetical protein